MSDRRHQNWWDYRPGLESLERRALLAQIGIPWHDAKHLSISFVPDGTSIAGDTSDLFKTLNAREPAAVWKQEILRAFQTWAVQADVNFSVVSDGGEPLGTPGPDQHDPRFGDIRIAARPMSPDVLSISVPHDPFLSGTWSGDVLLNSALAFDDGGPGLFPVLLHEVGHVLGLDDSSDPNSIMFPHLDNARDSLSPGDIAALQALYGPRTDDSFEGPTGSDGSPPATPFPTPTGYDGSTPLLLYSDLTRPRQATAFTLSVPIGYRGPVTVRLQTSGVSLLAPRLTVLDPNGQVVSDLVSDRNSGDVLQVTLPQVASGSSYVIKVQGATDGVFGIGEYALAASFDARSTVPLASIDAVARESYSYLSPDDIQAIFLDPRGALFHNDRHTNDAFATAEPISPAAGYGTDAPDRITASLGNPTDVDFYRVETPEPDQGLPIRPVVMTVTGRATEVNGLMPTVTVYDRSEHLVPALILAHGNGTFTIQVADAQPGQDYFIRVIADPTSGKIVGNYDLDVEFGHNAAVPTTFIDAVLGGSLVQKSYVLIVNQAQLFDFMLAAQSETSPPGSVIRMTVLDAEGRTVAARVADLGETAGGDPLLLVPGLYQVNLFDEASNGSPPPSVRFLVYGGSLSDPIGPALDDPTLSPINRPSTLGTPAQPYTWLALTLSSPRSPSRSSSLAATSVLSVDGPGGGQALPGGPLFRNAGNGSLVATSSNARGNGTGQGTPPGHLAPALGRPPQSSSYVGHAATIPTAALRADFLGDFRVGVDAVGFVGPWRVSSQKEFTPLDPIRQPSAPVETRPPVTDSGQPGLGSAAPSEGRPSKASRIGLPPTLLSKETKPRAAVSPGIVILGVLAVAYGQKQRPRVIPVRARPLLRRAFTVRTPHPDPVAAHHV